MVLYKCKRHAVAGAELRGRQTRAWRGAGDEGAVPRLNTAWGGIVRRGMWRLVVWGVGGRVEGVIAIHQCAGLEIDKVGI